MGVCRNDERCTLFLRHLYFDTPSFARNATPFFDEKHYFCIMKEIFENNAKARVSPAYH